MKISIIYASASGNTFFVAQNINNLLADDFDPSLHRAEQTSLKSLINSGINHIIFATSTWEHGEINPYFQPILDEIPNLDLSKSYGAFIGTGDIRYEPILFCKGMEILRDASLKSGLKEITSPLKINGDPFDSIDTVVTNWGNKLMESLEGLHE